MSSTKCWYRLYFELQCNGKIFIECPIVSVKSVHVYVIFVACVLLGTFSCCYSHNEFSDVQFHGLFVYYSTPTVVDF